MRMKPRDPAEEILKAYYNMLNGSIFYNGEAVKVGTKIPRRIDRYVLLYIDDISPENTGEDIIYNVIVALQIVSMQDTTEGDESVVNSIFEQVLELLGDPDGLIMNNFRALMSTFAGSERDTEMTDANYIITRKLRMFSIIEQLS